MIVVPDSPDVLHALFLGHLVVKRHKGEGITESIPNCLQQYDIIQSHYLRGSFGGAYFSLGVHNKLDSYFGLSMDKKIHHDWDPSTKLACKILIYEKTQIMPG